MLLITSMIFTSHATFVFAEGIQNYTEATSVEQSSTIPSVVTTTKREEEGSQGIAPSEGNVADKSGEEKTCRRRKKCRR